MPSPWLDEWFGNGGAVGSGGGGVAVTGACECGGTVCLCPLRFAGAEDDEGRWSRGLDRARDAAARLGLRGYRVAFVHTRWTGRARGDGVEEPIAAREVLPPPVVEDLGGITRSLSVAQLDEQGTVLVSKISAAYTEDQVLCRPPAGRVLPPNEAIFYELRQVRGGARRRFVPLGGAAPTYKPAGGWSVALTLLRQGRR